MKSRTMIAVAVASSFAWSGAFAFQYQEGEIPSAAYEVPQSMTTLNSLDRMTGGYKGWGPMANPQTPHTVAEVAPAADYFNGQREEAQHLAEVHQVADQVWVANAPLRSEYDNIGATRDRAGGGFLRFFGR
jgi:hypothetical protein